MKMSLKEIGGFLRERREELGLTVEEVVEKSEVLEGYYRALEEGVAILPPFQDRAVAIARALQMHPAFLVIRRDSGNYGTNSARSCEVWVEEKLSGTQERV